MSTPRDRVRAVADAVLYEGYLLYPYRASSQKNQIRWQFGVLGPPGAERAGVGENDTLAADFVVQPHDSPSLTLVLRFLQVQHRGAERATDAGYQPVQELTAATGCWLSWDEAVERETVVGPVALTDAREPRTLPIRVAGGTDIEDVDGGRLVRTRRDLRATLTLTAQPDHGVYRIRVTVRNTTDTVADQHLDKEQAVARSLIGAHLIAEVTGGEFVSLLDPPTDAAAAVVRRCRQHRCFPVLAGPAGTTDLLLVSPIILYDHPEIAEHSQGDLYDACEIDEILTLRIMTLTEAEKTEARATDPLAARIIDRCDSMSPDALLGLHGRELQGPELQGSDSYSADRSAELVPEIPDGVDWWDPMADTAVDPAVDAVLVNGVAVRRGSKVRLHPSRRADAQDLFFADQVARVTSVHQDVDGAAHIGVVLDADPAAELHDWYGRYLYFAPDEVEPLEERSPTWK